MRNCILFIFLFLLFINHAVGQDLSTPGNMGNNRSTEKEVDVLTIENLDIESEIFSWQLIDQFSRQDSFVVDSSTINFHNYNPIFKNSISNNNLGYVGSPYKSNLFFTRKTDSDFYFLQNLRAYNLQVSDVSYYNTTTPYASLMYEQGQNEDQMFDAFFTRNIDSLTNFGFQFNVLKAMGEFSNQEATHRFLNFFISRNTTRYNTYFTLIKGSNNIIENGGSIDPKSNLSFNLPKGIKSENNSFSIFTSFEYMLGQIPFLNKLPIDTINNNKFNPKFAVQYSAIFNNNDRQLIEDDVNDTYFDTVFIRSNSHVDSVSFTKFSHVFQLKALEDEQRKFTFGKRVFIENEIIKAVHPLPYGQRNYTYSNVFIGGEIYQNTNDFLKWRVNARFAVLGRNIGDALVKASVDKPLVFRNDTTALSIQGWYRDISPDIFQEHWYSNHYKWENDFKKQHEVVLRSMFKYPKIKFKAGIDYALYSNFIYNNQIAIPDQYDGEFSIISAWLNKDFVLGRFVWSNKMVWQEQSNNSVLHLPTWSFYSSIYYSHYLFKVMQIQLGAEIYYHSAFNADYYNPTTTHFYIQDELLTGGITNMNLYVNAKLKRTSAFAQLVNVNRNQFYSFGENYSSPLYPLEQVTFRFGFFWTFYD